MRLEGFSAVDYERVAVNSCPSSFFEIISSLKEDCVRE
jgi:hypothetical protein